MIIFRQHLPHHAHTNEHQTDTTTTATAAMSNGHHCFLYTREVETKEVVMEEMMKMLALVREDDDGQDDHHDSGEFTLVNSRNIEMKSLMPSIVAK